MTTIPAAGPETSRLIERMDEAVQLADRSALCEEVKAILKDVVAQELAAIPDALTRGVGGETYARRLLHQCPNKTYSAIVMVWEPGQGTPIHDHAGSWCVECLLKGSIEVVGYDPVGEPVDGCRFVETKRDQAKPGDVGILVPPNEYHTIRNNTDEEAVTIHVYEGEMLWCHTFEERGDGTYSRRKNDLSYTE